MWFRRCPVATANTVNPGAPIAGKTIMGIGAVRQIKSCLVSCWAIIDIGNYQEAA
jgi:hypothetical protein